MNTAPILRTLRWTIPFLLLTTLLSGCLPITGSSLRSVHKQEMPLFPTQPVENTAVPQITDAPEMTATPESPAAGNISPAVAPLRFTLPTQDDAPISLWRPALYPNPWALGPFDHFYFARPIAADEVNWPLADYRYGGIFPGTTDVVHTGIDIDAVKYTPVLAAAKGKVVWADYGLFEGQPNPDDPYGLAVAIEHDFGWNGQRLYTIYAHMDKIIVTSGQEVEQGQQIGVVGETGNTTGPHLHFEVRLKNNNFYTTYNPELWLSPPVGWGVLVAHLENTNGSMLTTQEVTVKSVETGRRWVVRSYGYRAVNSDPYYQENMVLSDLPSGKYVVIINYLDDFYSLEVEIQPGAVTYFSFQGKNGYQTDLPPALSPSDWLHKTPTAPPR